MAGLFWRGPNRKGLNGLFAAFARLFAAVAGLFAALPGCLPAIWSSPAAASHLTGSHAQHGGGEQIAFLHTAPFGYVSMQFASCRD